MQTKFRVLAELGDKLEKTKSRILMVDFVADFLKNLSTTEIKAASAMILGRYFPKGDSKTLEVSWSTVNKVVKRLIDVDDRSFANIFSESGDLGETIKKLFELGIIRRQATLLQEPLTILEVARILEGIATTRGQGARRRKERLLEILLGVATPLETKYIVKILINEMRTGFHDGLMELAVSKAFDIPHEVVRKATMITGDVIEVVEVAETGGMEGVSKLNIRIFRPIKPMLAWMAGGVEEALNQHGGKTAFEFKLDGARVQIHISGGKVRIFSRRLADITESFPEIVKLVGIQIVAKEAILEGEIIAVGNSGVPLPFQHLMRRFRRVRNIKKMVKRIPVQLQLFDLLYINGKSLIDAPYVERRKNLEIVHGETALVEQKIINSKSEAQSFLEEAIDKGHEGLVAKKLCSPYSPGIRGKLWLKIKMSLEPLDLVIIAAEYGYGRRHKWLSDYYLASYDPETGAFLLVGKTFKGLTDREIKEMTQRLKELKIKEEGRRVSVTPKVVVEVVYNEIQASPKYKSGMALRFARITRIRDDKSLDDVDTIQKIRKIYEKQFDRKARFSKL
jgi:DNA ligase-1